MNVIVGITGGSCSIYAVSLLKALKGLGVETHTVMSRMGEVVMRQECGLEAADIRGLSSHYYDNGDLGAPIASGSFKVDSMIVVPCSMKTLSAINSGYSDGLISRAADVCLKERRKLVVVTRETPLSSIHLANMLSLSQQGAVIFPPTPGFYSMPETLEDVIINLTGRMMDSLGIENELSKRWGGL